MSFIKDIFTEPNNTTWCPIRIVGILGSLQGLIMAGFDFFWNHVHVDLLAFGGGLAATVGALGLALGQKKDSL